MKLRVLAFFGVLLGLLTGCPNAIRSRDLLQMANASDAQTPRFEPVHLEVATFFQDNVPDAYWNPSCVNALLDPSTAVGPLSQAIVCASRARGLDAEDACYHALFDALRLPRTPPPDQRTALAWAREQDITRLETNLKGAIRATVSHYLTAHLKQVDPLDPEIRKGLIAGLSHLLEYQTTRQVFRDRTRPVSTLVMAGGAARGAYSAGATWWLLDRLNACKTDAEARIATSCGQDAACKQRLELAPENACLGDKVDMVAGTSTGSLITLLVKDYFDPLENRRQRALDMLVKSYTCSVNSDLYCVMDAGLNDLGLDANGKARGLVRFDGIQKSLGDYVDERMLNAPTEYFATTVDFESGRTLHLSSADRRDVPDVTALRQSAIASIVEPVLAEPVNRVGTQRGTLIDGGVRSGLPLLTPLLRGAERAVVFANGPLEPIPLSAPPPNALSIGLRMIDLFSHQPIVGELHEAESRLSVKRSLEYERCAERLSSEFAQPQDPVPLACQYTKVPQRALMAPPVLSKAAKEDKAALEEEGHQDGQEVALHQLCSGEVWPSDGQAVTVSAQQGPEGQTPFPHEVSRSYRSAWMFVPHELPVSLSGPDSIEPSVSLQSLGAAGYEFDPKAMWQLFVMGAATAHQRCTQLDDVLGWHLGPWCGTVDTLRQELAPIRKRAEKYCWTKDTKALRDCTP